MTAPSEEIPPSDPNAISMFTAHRLDDVTGHLSHAAERVAAAVKASGALRRYHVQHLCHHIQLALDHGHQLTENVRRHYPAEAAELSELNKTIGLAKSFSPRAKAATFSHLLQTILYHSGHASRHALALRDHPGTPAGQAFDLDHVTQHVNAGLEHAQKLRQHLEDNYGREAGFLRALDRREDVSLSAQLAGPPDGTLSAQLGM